MSELYSKKFLLEALKQAKLPYTYKTLTIIEKRGTIPQPNRLEGSNHRIYTLEQINEVIRLVGAYKDAKKTTQPNNPAE